MSVIETFMGETLVIEIERVDMHKTCWESYVWFARHPDGIHELGRSKTKQGIYEIAHKKFPDHNIKIIKKNWL